MAVVVNLTVEKVLDSVRNVLSMPDIFYRIDRAVKDPAASLDDIGAIILEDQGLTTRLIRLANSAYFGFPQRITNVTRALTVIGTNQLRDLVMATLVMKQFKDIPQELIDINRFWCHSIASGLVARVIASYRHEDNVEAFYVLGLIHDIGRLVLLMAQPKLYSAIMEKSREALNAPCPDRRALLFKLERAVMGFSHADVGGELLKTWNLPINLREPVSKHHAPLSAKEFSVEADITHLADILSHTLRLGSSGEPFVPPLDMGSFQRLQLDPTLLPAIAKQVEQQYAGAVSAFLKD